LNKLKEQIPNNGVKINLHTLNISVIITAYDRKKFIGKAIESVIKQEIDTSRYELIVVSNYNLEFDQFLTKIPIFNIVMEGNVGEFLYAGIRKAKYDLVAFLDDDDEFELRKLDRALSFFENDDKLVYYHNSLNYIDDNDNRINYSRMVESRIQRHRSKLIIFNSSKGIEKLELALTQSVDFNISCIVIRRNNLEPYLEILKSIASNQDGFFFWVSLISGGNIMVDPERLTKYRVHAMNVTKSITFTGKAIEIKKQIKTYTLLLEHLYQKYNSSENAKNIISWIGTMKVEYELILLIFLQVKRKMVIYNLKVLYSLKSSIKNTLKYRLLFLSLIYLISPKIATLIYRKIS
jgi:glycosyltransferase involved in cell wall biosynthesis